MLVEKTIGEILKENSKKSPEALAIVSRRNSTRITWSALDKITDCIAINLKETGLKKGERIGIIASNISEWIMIFFACSKIGVVTVPINANLTEEEIEYILRISECKVVFFEEKFRQNNLLSIIRSLQKKHISGLKQFIYIGNKQDEFINFDRLKQPQNLDVIYLEATALERIQCKDNSIILFTSGSTNLPKGVMLSHYNLINNALTLAKSMQISEQDTVCLAPPLFHCFGVTASLLIAAVAGTTVALLNECTTKNLIETIEEFKCTVLSGVPTMFTNIIHFKDLGQYDVSSLSKGIIAGAKYSEDLFKEISHTLKMAYLIPSYGQTECSPACTIAHMEDSIAIRSKSVGKKLEDIEIKIIHLETGEEVKAGEYGELCIKGYNVMLGYCDKAQSPVDDNNWLHTGDLGYVDEAGYYYITGRLKDIIIRGGENISPFEIEEVIKTLDNIKECKVIGIEDTKYGEEIVACITVGDVTQVNEVAIKNYVGKRLAKYKVPKHIVVMDTLCMTGNGKINKKLLKEKVVQILWHQL